MAAAQHSFRLDDRILVAYDVIELSVIADDRVLHDDAVANDSIFSDLDAAEKNRILYAAFDDAAISYERIGDMRFFHVFGRRFVLDFGIDAVIHILEEQFMPDAAVAQVHVDQELTDSIRLAYP